MQNMFKFNNRSTKCCSAVFIVNFQYIWRIVLVCFLLFEHVNGRWNTLLPNLNLSMPFRIGFRSPVTFKTKLYVTTANNNFQPLPIFCHKELHLRCCIGLELNIVTWYTKILKGIGDHSHQMPHPMIKCNLEKIWKTNPCRCPKNTLPEIFCIH